MIKIRTKKTVRIRQGDIYRDIEYIEHFDFKNDFLEARKITYPYAMILSQDCDLEQDTKNRQEYKEGTKDNQDKFLISILVAPLYNAEHFFLGEHLTDLGIKSAQYKKDKTDGKKIIQNETPRYHYIEFPGEVDIYNAVIDFKHFFTVNLDYLKKIRNSNFVCSISELFREDISQRFAFYLSRIGLPSDKKREGEKDRESTL